MTKREIIQRIAENHNRVAQMMVSGNNAILAGDTIRDLRDLVACLNEDLKREQSETAEGRTEE